MCLNFRETNFRGLQINRIFADFIFADEGCSYFILYIYTVDLYKYNDKGIIVSIVFNSYTTLYCPNIRGLNYSQMAT